MRRAGTLFPHPEAPLPAGVPRDYRPPRFRILERVGEGTFSVVYRAVLDDHDDHDHEDADADDGGGEEAAGTGSANGCAAAPVREARGARRCGRGGQRPPSPRRRHYAVKRLFLSNSGERVRNEVSFLRALHGQPHLPRLEFIYRVRDEVCVVTPFYAHHSFRQLIVDTNAREVVLYMRGLLRALAALHERNVLHRDVKPSNYLYDRETGESTLVDFGLAQRVESLEALKQKRRRRRADHGGVRLGTTRVQVDLAHVGRVRVPEQRQTASAKCDARRARPPMHAPRAGTRGFRAPEVLLRSPEQGTAVDVWSAGVVFLSLLACRYPFFGAADDRDALVELAQVLGSEPLREAAHACGRHLFLPYRFERVDLRQTCQRMRANSAGRAHLRGVPDAAYDLLARMLAPEWRQRITAAAALEHELFRHV